MHSAAVVVVPTTLDVDLDTVILLTLAVNTLGIVRGREQMAAFMDMIRRASWCAQCGKRVILGVTRRGVTYHFSCLRLRQDVLGKRPRRAR